MNTHEFLIENEVSKETLVDAFNRALMHVSFDSDGDVVIKDMAKVFIIIQEEKTLIQFMAGYGFNSSA